MNLKVGDVVRKNFESGYFVNNIKANPNMSLRVIKNITNYNDCIIDYLKDNGHESLVDKNSLYGLIDPLRRQSWDDLIQRLKSLLAIRDEEEEGNLRFFWYGKEYRFLIKCVS